MLCFPQFSYKSGIPMNFCYKQDASINCFKVIKRSWEELEAVSTMKNGLQELSKKFRTCKGLHSQYSARDWLSGAFVYTAMVNYPTAANFMAPLPGYPVEQVRYSFVKVCHRVFSFSRPSFSLASDVQDHRRVPSRIQ
jgi:lysosomal Pro-X carboxypeptidase